MSKVGFWILDFRIWTGIGTYDYVCFLFLFSFSFPYILVLFCLGTHDILRDGSTKSGSSKAFRLVFSLSSREKAKAQKARFRDSPACLIGPGGFSGFILFAFAIAISCLGVGVSEVWWENCPLNVFEMDWTGLDWI
jgi:hypothetical protein